MVGAGEMAELTATHLRSQSVGRIGVANRSAARAAALAAKVDGVAVPWEEITGELTGTDIVLTATGAPRWLLTRAQVAEAMRPRRDRPLFMDRHRACPETSSRRPATSSRSSSTTSTTCNRSSARTSRDARRKWTGRS